MSFVKKFFNNKPGPVQEESPVPKTAEEIKLNEEQLIRSILSFEYQYKEASSGADNFGYCYYRINLPLKSLDKETEGKILDKETENKIRAFVIGMKSPRINADVQLFGSRQEPWAQVSDVAEVSLYSGNREAKKVAEEYAKRNVIAFIKSFSQYIDAEEVMAYTRKREITRSRRM